MRYELYGKRFLICCSLFTDRKQHPGRKTCLKQFCQELLFCFAMTGTGALQHFFKNLMDFGVAFACFLSLDGMQQRAAVFLMSLIFRNFFQIGSRVKTHNLFKYRMDLLRRFSCFLCRFRMQFSACIARFCMGVIGELKFWMCHNDLSSF